MKLEIDTTSVIRAALALGALWLAGVVLWSVKSALVLIVISGFLALALNRPVTRISGLMPRGNRLAATAVAYIIVIGILSLLIYLTVPTLQSEMQEFVDRIPKIAEDLEDGDGAVASYLRENNIRQEASELAADLTDQIGNLGGSVFSGIGTVLGSLFNLLTVFVMTFLMLVEGPKWLGMLWAAYPKKYVKEHRIVADKMYDVIHSYFNGQLIIAAIAGASAMAMMLIVGVPFAVPLALLVGFMVLVPLIGATIGAFVVVLVALTESLTAAVAAAVFFLIYQQVENNIIQPYIHAKSLDLSPLIVFVAVIIGMTTWGIMGAFFAIPVAGCTKVIIDHFIERNSRAQSS